MIKTKQMLLGQKRLGLLCAMLLMGLAVVGCETEEVKQEKFNQNFNQAYALTQAGKHQEAIPLYKKAIRKQSKPNLKANAYNNLGWSYMQIGEYDNAILAYQSSLKHRPNDQRATNNLRAAQAKRQEKSAEAAATASPPATSPDSPAATPSDTPPATE